MLTCLDSREAGIFPSPAPVPSRTRILIADDRGLVRAAIACLLDRCGYDVVGVAADGADAVAQWRQLRPDIVLLELRMPRMSGIAAIEAIRAVDEHACCVILTALDAEEHAMRALRAGARGYIQKGASKEVLCQCLDTVQRGSRYIQPELAALVAVGPAGLSPTQREMEVLTGLTQGLSNKLIGRRLGIEEGTVKAHLKGILRKLDATSRTEAVSIAIRRGLVEV